MKEFYTLLSGGIACGIVMNAIPYADRIYDIGHRYIKLHNNCLPDVLIPFNILLSLIYLDKVQLKRMILIEGYILWTKALLTWQTILPCLKEKKSIKNFGIFGGHNDYLPISGHMALTTLCCLYLKNRIPYYNLMELLQCLLLISMRRHYTVEVSASMLYVRLLDRYIKN